MPLPNMTQKLSRLPSAWLAGWIVCGAFSGCELARPNFQMNSNSPNPFFGIDLLPRRRTASIISPPAGLQMATTSASSTEVADDSPARSRFWKRNAQPSSSPLRTVILPLSKPDSDQPIDRGPVELLL